jgi:hypothetical protein
MNLERHSFTNKTRVSRRKLKAGDSSTFIGMKRPQLLAIFALLMCGLSWSLASPIGAASDDNFHLASIWCSHGYRQGICEDSVLTGFKRLPVPIANAGSCYIDDREKSASCTNLELAEFGSRMIPTDRFAADGILTGQQSVFYWVNGLLVTSNIQLSVFLMRFLNSFLLLTLLTLAMKARSVDENLKIWVVLLSISLPVFMWTVNSNSSSSWTFLGMSFSWFFFDALLLNSTRSKKVFSIIGLILTMLLALGSRSESVPMLLVQFAALIGLRLRIEKSLLRNGAALLLVIPLFVILGFLFFYSGLWRMFTNAFSYVNDDTPITHPESWVVLHNLQAIPMLYYWLISAIGVFGSADFELYGTVGVLMAVVLTIVVVESLRKAARHAQITLLVTTFTAIAVPLVLLQSNKLLVGEELLPRYVFPLFVLLVGLCVFQNSAPFRLGRGQSIFIALSLSFVHLIVLRQVILRHVVGIESFGLFNLNRQMEWWWTLDSVPSPMTVWILGSISFSFLTFSTLAKIHRT